MRHLRSLLSATALALAIPHAADAQRTATPRPEPRPAARPAAPAVDPAHPVKEFGTMWTFDAPPLAYWKERYGFEPDQPWLDHVRLSAVRIPGCSASIVSAQGLVLTNHHCARACVAGVSPTDTNYVEVGFAALAARDEKKCPGMWADQLQSIEDVTEAVRRRSTGATATLQTQGRAAAIDSIQSTCRASTQLNCEVVTLFNGSVFSLYRFKRYDDIRLVMAPEEKIAFYGGDPDNFTYPRYDLDMALLRIYEGDQPLRPREFLRWNSNGAAENEVVFVVGNPGSTGRMLTVAQMEYLRDVTYPAQLAALERQRAILTELSSASPEAARQFHNQLFSISNSHKAISGYLRGLQDTLIMRRKREFERDFRSRITRNPALRAQFGAAWDAIATALREQRTFALQARWHTYGGGTLFNWAGALVRLPAESVKHDSLRLMPYRGPGLENIRNTLGREQPVNMALERRLLAAQLAAAQRELPAADPYLRTLLAGRTPEQAAEALLSGTKLADLTARKALLEGGSAAIAGSTDPLIVAARQLDPAFRAVIARQQRIDATISANAAKIGQAMYAAYGRTLPPDATFSIRISDGVVRGYPYNGTLAPWRTSFYGLYARATEMGNKGDFELPRRWDERRGRLTMTTPFNFVSTNDIIGGNSGSPVINRSGEVVGLVFDGNIEMLPNRFIFTDEVSRTVSVHTAGMIEALRKMYDANRIADELEGRAPPASD